MNLQPCETWECINSFANWLSAFGTILISGIALWLSVQDRRINVSANLSLGSIPGDDPLVVNRRVYILEFTNIGHRPVTISSHYWYLPFRKSKSFLMPNLDSRVSHFCSKFPIELTDGKTGYIFYPEDFFSSVLDEPHKFLFHENTLVAWLRINFFKVKLSTSVGKLINVNVSKQVRKKLWRIYRAA